MLDRAGARARLAEIGARYGLPLDPDRPVGSLSVGEQQRLEIVKALYRGARVLILDEPTSVLTPQETDGLFAAIRAMAAQGVGVIFISHKLNEVRAITDRLVVMRQGAVVAESRQRRYRHRPPVGRADVRPRAGGAGSAGGRGPGRSSCPCTR